MQPETDFANSLNFCKKVRYFVDACYGIQWKKKESPTSFLIFLCVPMVEFPPKWSTIYVDFSMVVPDLQNELDTGHGPSRVVPGRGSSAWMSMTFAISSTFFTATWWFFKSGVIQKMSPYYDVTVKRWSGETDLNNALLMHCLRCIIMYLYGCILNISNISFQHFPTI